MRVLISTFLLVQTVLSNQDILCCKQASGFRRCKVACNKFVAQTDVTLRFRQLKYLPKHCPGHLTGFWRCLNVTNPVGHYVNSNMPNQAGVCCLLTSQTNCRHDCLGGKISSLNKSCAPATDQLHAHLLSCIDRHDVTAKCCKGASNYCIKSCKVVFSSETHPSSMAREKVKRNCMKGGQNVMKCVQKSVPQKCGRKSGCNSQSVLQLQCCSLATEVKCKRGCRQELLSSKSTQDTMTGLTTACEAPFESKGNSQMWNCLLKPPVQKEPTPTPVTGMPSMDGAKLQCCRKALSSVCWRLCIKMYTSSWKESQNYQKFDMACTYNPAESKLMNCITDVTKPCQLGCSGLNFCTNFNNRHTELFRSCTAKSDSHAKYHMQDWERGVINMPGMPIPVQDIKTCLPDTWKAIACVLQIKPCSIKSHRSTICKSDCVRILKKCGNSSHYMVGKTAEDMCNKLSPSEDQSSCISIREYLKPSKYTDITDEVTHPCNPNPCQKSKICDINRTCYAASLDGCEPHTCVPGCPLGEASKFLVRMGEYARVPVASGQDGCFRVCHCGGEGKLSRCTNLDCVYKKTCPIKGEQQPKQHGERFMVRCNFCACFAGELMCTKRQCIGPSQVPDESGRPKRNHSPDMESSHSSVPVFTGLPCGCKAEHHPVCATDGRTYPNTCIAKCAGLKNIQLEIGNCESIDPCKGNPCSKGERCIIDRKTCLSPKEPCSQYYCVATSSYCKDMQLEPVCDTDSQQHPNLCSLHFQGKRLAYKGFCKAYCRPPTKSVCGVNGETYSSHCAAHSARVIVDYEGHCRAIGHGSALGQESRCANVKCRNLVPSNCVGVSPLGACCPHCAAQIRILVSLTQLNINSQGVRDYGPVTLDHLLLALRRHVTTSECDLFGYQSIEDDVVILIMAITEKPTILQIAACSLEAQKIEALINTGSPSFTSDVLLSTLKGAQTETPSLSALTQGSSQHNIQLIHLLAVLLHTFLILKWILRS